MDQAAHPFFWFRTPVWWITAAFYLLLGGVLAGLPLTNYLGLEFSLVVGIVAGFLAGPLAIGYFHRRLPTTDPAAARLAAWEIGPTRLWIEASLWHLSALAFALVGLLVRFFLTEPCAPGRGMGFFLLLPVVSVFYAGAWGLACGSLLLRPRTAKIIVTLIALGTLVGTGLNFLKKPTVYVYNPFFGHFPGPIYDEAATPHLALIAYRLANLAEAWLIVVTLLLFFWRTWVTPRPRPGVLPWFLFIALAATSMSIHQARFDLGFDMTTERLVDKLGGHKATRHFDIYYPKKPEIERHIDRIARDHEFRFRQIEQTLDFSYPHRISSFIYPSGEAKKKWIGAGGTDYADCHNHHMHVNWEGEFPLDILHHELVHVMLSDFGLPVLGFSPKITITEGIAVSLGGPMRWDTDLDTWTAGMKAIDRLPRLKNILGLGFWTESGARAYVAAGSFVRYLMSLEGGREKILEAYGSGDIAEAFDRPLTELERDWHAHLEPIEARLSETDLARARYRFGFKSMFEMRCPREVGRLLGEAKDDMRQRYYHKADIHYRRAAELDRNNARLARYRLRPLLRLGRTDQAAEAAHTIVQAQGTPDAPARDHRGRVVGSQVVAQQSQLVLAEIAWRKGDVETAEKLYREIRDADLRGGLTRQAACALYAMEHPAITDAIMAYLTDFEDTRDGKWRLLLTADAAAPDPVVSYLLARRAYHEEAYEAATDLLERALATELPHPSLYEEATHSLAYAQFMTGDLAAARATFESLSQWQRAHGGDALESSDWLARLDAWPTLTKALTPPPS